MSNRRPFTITQVVQHEEGYYTARVSDGTTSVVVDNRDGSWLADVRDRPGARSFHREFVLPHVAVELQKKVAPLIKQAQAEKVVAEAVAA